MPRNYEAGSQCLNNLLKPLFSFVHRVVFCFVVFLVMCGCFGVCLFICLGVFAIFSSFAPLTQYLRMYACNFNDMWNLQVVQFASRLHFEKNARCRIKTLGAGKTASPAAHFSLTNALKAVAFVHGSEVMDKCVGCCCSLTLVCHEPSTH